MLRGAPSGPAPEWHCVLLLLWSGVRRLQRQTSSSHDIFACLLCAKDRTMPAEAQSASACTLPRLASDKTQADMAVSHAPNRPISVELAAAGHTAQTCLHSLWTQSVCRLLCQPSGSIKPHDVRAQTCKWPALVLACNKRCEMCNSAIWASSKVTSGRYVVHDPAGVGQTLSHLHTMRLTVEGCSTNSSKAQSSMQAANRPSDTLWLCLLTTDRRQPLEPGCQGGSRRGAPCVAAATDSA